MADAVRREAVSAALAMLDPVQQDVPEPALPDPMPPTPPPIVPGER